MSAYEQSGLTGLFSMMTHEQLVNWVLCGAAYVARVPEDASWLQASMSVFKSAFASLKNRRAELLSFNSLSLSLTHSRTRLHTSAKVWRTARMC